jgi:hypothetical protein
MSRLQQELNKRAQEPRTYTDAERAIKDKYDARKASLVSLSKNKDFKEYLKLEEEMNNPQIVIAHKCGDPVCEGLKAKIRDYQARKKLLLAVLDAGNYCEPPRASR